MGRSPLHLRNYSYILFIAPGQRSFTGTMTSTRSTTMRTFRTTGLPRLAVLAAALAACTTAGAPAGDAAPADTPRAVATPPARPTPDRAALLEALRRVEAESGGELGFAVLHVESGERVSLHGDRPYFMASVTKLPVSLAALRAVQAGRVRLDDTVTVERTHLSGSASRIVREHPQGGGRFTVRDLIHRAVSESDNAASDALLRVAGGPQAVSREIAGLGAGGVRVDRPYTLLSWDYAGVESPPPPAEWSRAAYQRETARISDAQRAAAVRRFHEERRRDTATPDAAVDLLAALARGRALDAAGTALLLERMTDTKNPAGRIVAGVPAGTPVAHKTGTWEPMIATNDVGLVTLPDGAGTLAIAAFVRDAPSTERAEKSIAAATRLAWEAWTAGR